MMSNAQIDTKPTPNQKSELANVMRPREAEADIPLFTGLGQEGSGNAYANSC
jgi:hypothetical protein